MLRRPARPVPASLLTLALATGLAVLPAASAQAAPSETSVSIQLRRTVTSSPAVEGRLVGVYWDRIGPALREDTFAITGRLTEDTAGTGLAGQDVVLLRSKKTESTSRVVATTTTGDDGSYRFTGQHVVGSAAYYVAFEGDGGVTYNGSDSMESVPPVLVRAMRDFNATKRKVNGRLFFRGDVNPGWGGRKVTLQRKKCASCSWRTVTSKAAGARGAWSFRVSYPRRVGPVWRYQAVLARAGNFEKSYSAQLTTKRVYARDAAARAR